MSDELNQICISRKLDALHREELSPLGESSAVVFLEVFSAVEMTILIEVVVDRFVDGERWVMVAG